MRMRITGLVLPLSIWTFAACSSAPKDERTTDGSTLESTDTTPSAEVTTPPTQDLGDEAERMSLAEQKRRFLVDSYLDRARELMDRLQLEDAQRELALAYEIEPDNYEVKKMLSEVGALLGLPGDRVLTVTEQLGNEYEIRIQQLKAEAGDSLRKGKLALSRRDYDEAISELRLAINSIRWAPYSIDWEGVDTEAQALLAQAEAERDQYAAEERLDQQRRATEELREREQTERARRDAIVANILDQAIDAFDEGDFDDSLELADEALRKDPRNEQAEELRDAAFRAGRDKVRADYIQEKREEFALWREHLQELEIPWTDVITYPDRDEWRALSEERRSRRGLDLSKKISPSEAELRHELSTRTVQLPGIEEEESLRAVIDIIRNFTGLALVVDPAAENAVARRSASSSTSSSTTSLTAEQALNRITSFAGEGVTWTIQPRRGARHHDASLPSANPIIGTSTTSRT